MKTLKEILTPRILLNSAIAGALVFFGALSTGGITWGSIGFVIGAAGAAFVTQLKEEIKPKNKKGSLRLFNFINII